MHLVSPWHASLQFESAPTTAGVYGDAILQGSSTLRKIVQPVLMQLFFHLLDLFVFATSTAESCLQALLCILQCSTADSATDLEDSLATRTQMTL